MGASGPKVRERPDLLVRAIQHSLKDQAAREALTDAQFRGLDVKVHTDYDMHQMALHLRIAWRDPSGSGYSRCIDTLLDERTVQDLGFLASAVEGIVKNISLRGELFFFRLAKHFPNHLHKVECDGKGGIDVQFKNGQHIQAPETDVENSEFLAKCGMLYDL